MQAVDAYSSPLGRITLASDGQALTGLWFDGQKYFGAGLGADPSHQDLPVFQEAKAWLDRYFAGQDPGALPPLNPSGTPFRKLVWELLCQIPYGHTVTYGQLAAQIDQRQGVASMSSQAVGGAVGHNAVSLVIPCHRVVGSNGSLTGYAGGIDKKVRLLTLEKADMSALLIPGTGTV